MSAANVCAKTKTDEKESSFVNREKTGLVNLKWGQYLVVSFKEGYGLTNTRVTVDGTDVTDAMTKVTDDGSVVNYPDLRLTP
jgi:hypothetical protein